MSQTGEDRPLVPLHTSITTPPLSTEARVEMGSLLRRVQNGEKLSLPHSRPMPSIGRRVAELRVQDEDATWRLIYRPDPDAVVVADLFSKKTEQTPPEVITRCQNRLKEYDRKVAEYEREQAETGKGQAGGRPPARRESTKSPKRGK